ncbi:hypothetical protein KIF24_09855 [Micromonospora sp. Llam7]|uniref:hypothetical protein n=1 Tax=Micromonospora tarapacensis TaxID=2835305 RepID=UPI001C82C71F|nr:hypothetical protein [Micromonospora tarapacensis]MBX7266296.1 hypothetical protein [Micromonospora tarapacensis]
MEEDDFWMRLESRICGELQGFEDRQLRWNWCDGLVAEQYDLLREEPCIRGRAWVRAERAGALEVRPACRRSRTIARRD